jgi:4-carboxymuconolactone decarboxylase
MRLQPLPPESLDTELRFVHDEISNLITKSQGQASMIDSQGALLGPFPAMLHFPQFGIPALSFIRTLDTYATLDKKVREVAILTVGSTFGARFELYVHEIMAKAFGLSKSVVASLSAGIRPEGLNQQEAITYDIAYTLTHGKIVSNSTYQYAVDVLGKEAVGELFFLIGSYTFIAMILNGFDIPAPENNTK